MSNNGTNLICKRHRPIEDDDEIDEDMKIRIKFVVAAKDGDLKTVQTMLEDGLVTADCREDLGYSALYRASEQGHLEIVQALIQAGANVNCCRNFRRLSPLHVACASSKSAEVVDELVKAGADVNMVCRWNKRVIFELLTTHDDVRHKVEIMRLLIAAKCNLNVKNEDGETALLLICRYENMNEIFVLLVEAGADLMATTRKEGMNVLHLCVRTNKTALGKIKALLDHGIDVNCQDTYGRTALHYAVDRENVDVVEMLIQKGSDVFSRDSRGHTTLMGMATMNNELAMHTEESQLLLVHSMLNQIDSANASELINIQDQEVWTVLHHAVFQGSYKLVHELLDWRADVTVKSFLHGHSALHFAVERVCNNKIDNLQILQ